MPHWLRANAPRQIPCFEHTIQRLPSMDAIAGGYCNKAGKKGKPSAKRTPMRAAEDTKETRTRTTGVCWCDACTDGVGVEAAVYLRHFCKSVPEAHVAVGGRLLAKTVFGKKRRGRPIVFSNVRLNDYRACTPVPGG